MELFPDFVVVQETMAAEMQAERFLSKNLLQAVSRALSLRDVDLNLGSCNAILNFYELFGKVELGKGHEFVYSVLKE